MVNFILDSDLVWQMQLILFKGKNSCFVCFFILKYVFSEFVITDLSLIYFGTTSV